LQCDAVIFQVSNPKEAPTFAVQRGGPAAKFGAGRLSVSSTDEALSLAPGFSRVVSALVPENGFIRFLDGRRLESR